MTSVAVSSANSVAAPPPQGGNGEVMAAGPPPMMSWYMDDRDVFIAWLRGEFAAANAIVDLLVQHLRAVGEPGEYQQLSSALYQRRYHWTPLIHLQQHYPVGEVAVALEQIAWRRQHQQPLRFRHFNGVRKDKDGRNTGFAGNWLRHRFERNVEKVEDKEGKEENEDQKGEDRPLDEMNSSAGPKDVNCLDSNTKDDCSPGDEKNFVETPFTLEAAAMDKDNPIELQECGAVITSDKDGEQKEVVSIPREFTSMELSNGKMVNVVEGLQLYENFLATSEITRLLSLATEMRAAGHRGELSGQTNVIWIRPMKGHGREFIQLGIPITGGRAEEHTTQTSPELTVEAIPSSLEDIFLRLLQLQIVPVKPDFCVIDFFNEGDHSNPYIWPSWYGRPVCTIFLTDCDIVYGREVGSSHQGNYNGSLNLSVTPGSLLLVKGKSANLAKRAIPSLQKQRILLTFGKSHPKKDLPSVIPAFSQVASPPSWGTQGAIQNSAVLTTTPSHAQFMHTNGFNPLLVPQSLVHPAALPYPVTTITLPQSTAGWTVQSPATARHQAPRVPFLGTGVFFPPKSDHSPLPQQMQAQATPVSPERRVNGEEKSKLNSNYPKDIPKDRTDDTGNKLDCNGNLDGDADSKEDSQNAGCQ